PRQSAARGGRDRNARDLSRRAARVRGAAEPQHLAAARRNRAVRGRWPDGDKPGRNLPPSAAMSSLFDRLEALFEQGHRADIPDLLTDERFADASRTADAAVLIAVTDRPSPGVILTQRPPGLRDHTGQVAFPRGTVDPGETAVEAALREAEEELSMRPDHVRVIGTTDRYQTGTGFDVTPVLGVVPPDLPLIANPGEVEAWFEAPLDLLLDRDNWT